MIHSRAVLVIADDLPAVVDPHRLCLDSARNIDRGDDAAVVEEAMIAEEAYQLATIVDPLNGTRNSERGEIGPVIEEIPTGVGPGNQPAVIDPVGLGLRRAGEVDRGTDATAAQQSLLYAEAIGPHKGPTIVDVVNGAETEAAGAREIVRRRQGDRGICQQ